MRLVTFRTDKGEQHVGVVRGEQIVDLSLWLIKNRGFRGTTSLTMLDLIGLGEDGLGPIRMAMEDDAAQLNSTGALIAFEQEKLLAPIPRPPKNVLCLGRNYPEHAAESVRAFGEVAEVATYPTIFTKAPTTVIGPYADIPFDANVSTKIDWEVELAVVIGKTGKNIKRADAMSYVFGYMVLNDISARDIQKRHGNQFFKGKSLDGTCPTGPWIVTADELGDPSGLQLWTRVNGVEKQRGNTNEMIYDVATTIEWMSEGMTLEPGDIIATGTPAGVGNARVPPEYLAPGDVVESEVEKVGMIWNRVVGV